jgi:hypothetical protein
VIRGCILGSVNIRERPVALSPPFTEYEFHVHMLPSRILFIASITQFRTVNR